MTMRIGNTELLRSFYISLLGVVSLIPAFVLNPETPDWDFAVVQGTMSGIAIVFCYLALRHYKKVEEFKTRPYALFLLRGGIALSIVAIVIAVIPPLRG